jgi:hypothetical protein
VTTTAPIPSPPTTALPAAVHEYIDWLTDAVHAMGYQAAVQDIAARHAELDAAWRPIGRSSYEQAVADRVATMEHSARRFRTEIDRRHGNSRAAANWPRVADITGRRPAAAS